jgi:hypothetical protein
LRSEYASLRREARANKSLLPVLYTVLLEIVKIADNPLIVDPLLKTVTPLGDEELAGLVSRSILVPFLFYWAKHLLFTDRLAEAADKFLKAFQLLNDARHKTARQRILMYLVPLKIAQGLMPSKALLQRYGLMDVFGPMVKGVITGNINRVTAQRSMLSNEVTTGVLGLVELVAYRNLVKKTAGQNVLPIDKVANMIRLSLGETIDLLAQLMDRGMVTGSVDLQSMRVTLKAFPPPVWQ